MKRTAEIFARQDLQLGGLEAIENSFEGADKQRSGVGVLRTRVRLGKPVAIGPFPPAAALRGGARRPLSHRWVQFQDAQLCL